MCTCVFGPLVQEAVISLLRGGDEQENACSQEGRGPSEFWHLVRIRYVHRVLIVFSDYHMTCRHGDDGTGYYEYCVSYVPI